MQDVVDLGKRRSSSVHCRHSVVSDASSLWTSSPSTKVQQGTCRSSSEKLSKKNLMGHVNGGHKNTLVPPWRILFLLSTNSTTCRPVFCSLLTCHSRSFLNVHCADILMSTLSFSFGKRVEKAPVSLALLCVPVLEQQWPLHQQDDTSDVKNSRAVLWKDETRNHHRIVPGVVAENLTYNPILSLILLHFNELQNGCCKTCALNASALPCTWSNYCHSNCFLTTISGKSCWNSTG